MPVRHHCIRLTWDEARMRRLDARAEHMKGTRQLKIEGRILDSGGLLDDSGRMSSSAVLCDFPDCTALDVFGERTLHTKAGLVRRENSRFPRVDWDALQLSQNENQ